MKMKMKITYINTLYNCETTRFVFGEIEFKDGAAHFASGGHRYAVELEYIVKIEMAEAD